MYEITDYTKKKAKQLGVTVKPSSNRKKKIDVFKNSEKIASVGATGYSDYPHYIKSHGKAYADNRRALYRMRHKKDNGTNGYFANQLLW